MAVVIGDYRYELSGDGVSVMAADRTKTSYADIPETIVYEGVERQVTDMNYCFWGCTSLTQVPTIPSSVTNMNYCFWGCTRKLL